MKYFSYYYKFGNIKKYLLKNQQQYLLTYQVILRVLLLEFYCLASEIELRDLVFALLSIPVLINTLFDNKIVYTSQNTTVND